MAEMEEAFPDFEVNVEPGKYTVKLTRQVGDRNVEVELDMCNQDTIGGDEFDEEMDPQMAGGEEEPNTVHALGATVSISRPGKSNKLVMEVAIPIEEALPVEIMRVALADVKAKEGDADTAYAPPIYSELDVGLQTAFMQFLEDHGVGDQFADGVRAVADRKEQFEYVNFLKKVHELVEGTAVGGGDVIDA